MPIEMLLGLVVAAGSAMATAVGVLWRALEKRTDSHLAVNTEVVKTMVAIQVDVEELGQRVERIATGGTEQVSRLHAQMVQDHGKGREDHDTLIALLRELRAVIVERQRMGLGERVVEALTPRRPELPQQEANGDGD